MNWKRDRLGGIIHTYQRYDPARFPSPTAPPPDLVSGAFEHLMTFGDARQLTEEDLANAVHLDPSQIQGLGPSLDALIAMLEERKRKILSTYETEKVQRLASDAFHGLASTMKPPAHLADRFRREVAEEQLYALERMWYHAVDEHSTFNRRLVHLIDALGEKYQVDELASTYEFTGRSTLDVPEALQVKEELETIDRLLEQLREAKKNAKIGLIDMEELAEFAQPEDIENLSALQQQVQDLLREMAARQGIEVTADGLRLTPQAYRLFQGKLLEHIFSELQAARSGRHSGPIQGEGAVEIPRTRPYEFGDSVTHMDIPQSMINALVRAHGAEQHVTDAGEAAGTTAETARSPRGSTPEAGRIHLTAEDIEIHHTRNTPKCASVVILDMSGSMRHGGQYINAKRMGLALDGLIRSEYPGDYLQFIEMATFARPRHISEIPTLMPRPVTIYDPFVRLRADMSDPRISEMDIPPHFTNIQHALQLGRQFLMNRDTPNRQIMLITDGLPTAHFEENEVFLLYPPHQRTEEYTMREASRCAREDIVINVFLLPSWGQTEDDVQFAHRMVEMTRGRVFFTAGRDLDRYVIWDYVNNRRTIVS